MERRNIFSETNSNHFFLSEDICPCKTNHSLTAFGRKRGQIPKTKTISTKKKLFRTNFFSFFHHKDSKVRILGTAENRFLPMVQKHSDFTLNNGNFGLNWTQRTLVTPVLTTECLKATSVSKPIVSTILEQ